MTESLRRAIRQEKPFASREQEAYLGVLRTAAVFEHGLAELLKPHGITHTQYNVLRILRGAGAGGLCRNEVRDRMIARVPDATRLLDRLEDMALLERRRDAEDRRFVTARLTDRGRALLAALDEPVLALHARQLEPLDRAGVDTLIALLDRVRQGE